MLEGLALVVLVTGVVLTVPMLDVVFPRVSVFLSFYNGVLFVVLDVLQTQERSAAVGKSLHELFELFILLQDDFFND